MNKLRQAMFGKGIWYCNNDEWNELKKEATVVHPSEDKLTFQQSAEAVEIIKLLEERVRRVHNEMYAWHHNGGEEGNKQMQSVFNRLGMGYQSGAIDDYTNTLSYNWSELQNKFEELMIIRLKTIVNRSGHHKIE